MPGSVHDVARSLRAQAPLGLARVKLHKLLYLCQGHHLADRGEPMFTTPIHAWDMGPVVAPLWKMEELGAVPADHEELDAAALNTIGYVLSRYGRLSGRNLIDLTHGQDPWRRVNETRAPGGSARIELEWIREYFTAARQEESDELGLNCEEVRAWLAGAQSRLAAAGPAVPDDMNSIRWMLTAGR